MMSQRSLAKRGANNPMYGRPVSIETRKKISLAHLGKRFSEERKQNMRDNHADFSNGKHPMFGKHLSDTHKKKLQLARLGRHHSAETKQKLSVRFSGKCHPLYGVTPSDETRRKQRVGMLKSLELRGVYNPIVGRNETMLLDAKEVNDHVVIRRSYRIHHLGYIVDGYCVETNTVYEVYEKRHSIPSVQKRDIERQRAIENFLGCRFEIIWDLPSKDKELTHVYL